MDPRQRKAENVHRLGFALRLWPETEFVSSADGAPNDIGLNINRVEVAGFHFLGAEWLDTADWCVVHGDRKKQSCLEAAGAGGGVSMEAPKIVSG